jgi:hypothetical protein
MEIGLTLFIVITAFGLVLVLGVSRLNSPRAPQPPQPHTPPIPTLAPAPASTHVPNTHVQVVFLADTPWGNAGEAHAGLLITFPDGQRAVQINDDSEASQSIPEDSPYVQVTECASPEYGPRPASEP